MFGDAFLDVVPAGPVQITSRRINSTATGIIVTSELLGNVDQSHALQLTLYRAQSAEGPFVAVNESTATASPNDPVVKIEAATTGKLADGTYLLVDEYGLSDPNHWLPPKPFYYRVGAKQVLDQGPTGREFQSNIVAPGMPIIHFDQAADDVVQFDRVDFNNWQQLGPQLAIDNQAFSFENAEFIIHSDKFAGHFYSSWKDAKRTYGDNGLSWSSNSANGAQVPGHPDAFEVIIEARGPGGIAARRTIRFSAAKDAVDAARQKADDEQKHLDETIKYQADQVKTLEKNAADERKMLNDNQQRVQRMQASGMAATNADLIEAQKDLTDSQSGAEELELAVQHYLKSTGPLALNDIRAEIAKDKGDWQAYEAALALQPDLWKLDYDSELGRMAIREKYFHTDYTKERASALQDYEYHAAKALQDLAYAAELAGDGATYLKSKTEALKMSQAADPSHRPLYDPLMPGNIAMLIGDRAQAAGALTANLKILIQSARSPADAQDYQKQFDAGPMPAWWPGDAATANAPTPGGK